MELTGDDLAGVVDIFGVLTRAELARALTELAFKQGQERSAESFDDQTDEAVESYQLIVLDEGSDTSDLDTQRLVAGPSAFPTVPENGHDLRHILDVEERDIGRGKAGETAAARVRAEADRVIDDGDTARAEFLVDVSYDIEAWASVDLSETRERLDSNL